jgi:hypothetical protein
MPPEASAGTGRRYNQELHIGTPSDAIYSCISSSTPNLATYKNLIQQIDAVLLWHANASEENLFSESICFMKEHLALEALRSVIKP